MSKVSKICGLQPCGSNVLIEILNVDEMLGTKLTLISAKSTPDGKGMDGAPQAIIVALGPKVNVDDWGFDVGDRVMFSTAQFVPAPDYDKYPRARGTIEPHSVKAVLIEEK